MVHIPLRSWLIPDDLIDVDDLADPISPKGKPKLKGDFKSHGSLPKLSMPVDSKSSESPITGSTDGTLTPTEGMSARQLNVLKRKLKANKASAQKVRIVDYSQSTEARRASVVDTANGASTPRPIKKQPETSEEDYFSITDQPKDSNKVVIEHKAPTVSALEAFGASSEAAQVWPFEGLVEILNLDLSDPVWETRHGAAIGLREVVRIHGAGAGRLLHLTKTENDKRNAEYLEDLALRCICVFLLDRFGDYVSDQVVAPIRESVAQLLGAVLVYMQPSSVVKVFRLLKRLVLQTDFNMDCGQIWEICHGGMLGIKYLVAVREDVFLQEKEVLDGVLECVLHGLANHDDDVRAVAAATLVPVAEQFISLRPLSVSSLVDTLWMSLEELRDDLSASTGSVMDLLAKLFSIPHVLEMITQSATDDEEKSFGVLIPRLFPFLRHTIRTVRLAVLRALRTFLGIKQQKGTTWISSRAMRLLFQNVLLEQNEEIRELSLTVWTELISTVSALELQSLYQDCLHLTASLLFTPIGTARNNVAMESNLIIRPSGQVWTPAVVKSDKPIGRKEKKKFVEDWSASQNKPHNLDGPVIRGDVELVGEDVMIRTRISGAKALARLIAIWPESGLDEFRSVLETSLAASWSSPRWLACIVIEESSRVNVNGNKVGILLRPKIASLVELSDFTESTSSDLVPFLQTLRRQCQALENAFVEHGKLASNKLPVLPVLVQGEPEAGPHAFTLGMATSFVEKEFEKLSGMLTSINKARASKLLQEARESLVHSIEDFKSRKEVHERRIVSAAASAVLWLGDLGSKLNPIIQGIMNSVKVCRLKHCV